MWCSRVLAGARTGSAISGMSVWILFKLLLSTTSSVYQWNSIFSVMSWEVILSTAPNFNSALPIFLLSPSQCLMFTGIVSVNCIWKQYLVHHRKGQAVRFPDVFSLSIRVFCLPVMTPWCTEKIPVEGNFGQTFDKLDYSINRLAEHFTTSAVFQVKQTLLSRIANKKKEIDVL